MASDLQKRLGYTRTSAEARLHHEVKHIVRAMTDKPLEVAYVPVHWNEIPKFVRHRAIVKGIDLTVPDEHEDREWREHGERLVERGRARGLTLHAVSNMYSCDHCGEKLTFVGTPFEGMLDFCPACGESDDGLLMRVLAVGDPIVLS